MIDEKFALLRTHRNNVNRYRGLLRTQLTELERQFIEKRLSEERAAMEAVAASTFPVHMGISNGAAGRFVAGAASCHV